MKARKKLSEIIGEISRERREKKVVETEKDLLSCLLSSKDENGGALSDEQIGDNVIGVLFAAQDTTASAMTWLVKYLHDNPKLLQAVKVCISLFRSLCVCVFVCVLIGWKMACRLSRRRYTKPTTKERVF